MSDDWISAAERKRQDEIIGRACELERKVNCWDRLMPVLIRLNDHQVRPIYYFTRTTDVGAMIRVHECDLRAVRGAFGRLAAKSRWASGPQKITVALTAENAPEGIEFLYDRSFKSSPRDRCRIVKESRVRDAQTFEQYSLVCGRLNRTPS